MAFFSNSERFSNTEAAIRTSFSLLLGDSIDDIVNDLIMNGSTSLRTFFALFYVFSFCFLFMLAVHNIWIAIIMEEL